MKTLIINAHPDYSNPGHFSLKLQNLFLEKFTENFPNEEAKILNIYENHIPRIAPGELQTIWNKQFVNAELTDEENKIAETSAHLLKQFKDYHRIVIVSPLYNFNIPSALKDYIDNIMIARETFRYLDAPDENGKISVGLMKDDYKMLLLYASGSIYTDGNIYQAMDFAPKYLQNIFQEVMGFSNFDIVRAEGTAVLSEEVVMNAANLRLEEAFKEFYTL